MLRELTRRERTRLNSFFSYWNVFDYFKDKILLIDDDKQVFMMRDKEFALRNNPIHAGLKVCCLRKHAHPSLSILQLFVDIDCGKRIIINDHAQMLFLYGRDIFGSSIIKHTNDFKANDEVIITNEYNEALGLGRARYDADKIMNARIAITNLMDLGFYLRGEDAHKYDIDERLAKLEKG